MRVIGGKYRSRVLASFEGQDVRPTADRVKESLFGILSPRLYGARVVDVFAGTGALGIEALSRGAKQAVFGDSRRESILLVKKNLSTLKIGDDEAVVYERDFADLLSRIDGQFDIVFLDPPYRKDYGVQALELVAKRNLLNENGVVVYERDEPYTAETFGLEKTDERKYGKTYLTFFERKQV